MNGDDRTSLERAIAEWQGPIYNLAYRMLGNEADAADAAQEVILAVVRQWARYDPSRPLKPWLFKVALHRIHNFHRGAAARARREIEASRRMEAFREGDPVEDEDLKRRVHDALARLPAHDRSLIVLHYYSGLSQVEMAASLSLSRTTVQSRLARALERLREALTGLGCVVAVPAIEAAMRATPPLEVPAGLASALSALPSAAGGTVASTLPATLGGLLMAKKMLVVSAVVVGCLLASGGAYSTGKWRGKTEMERIAAAEAASAAASREEREELRARNEELSLELRTLRAHLAETEAAAALAEREWARASKEPGAGGEESDGGDEAEGEIDWSKLALLFAERLDLVYDLNESGRDRQPTRDERQLMAELERALNDVFSKARLLSEDPFYDKRILLGLCEAMCAPALGLSEAKGKELRDALAKVFAERVEGFDPDAALPAETYRVRQSFFRGLDEAMAASVDETQAERYQKISALARRFLEGDCEQVWMASAPEGGAEAREAAVLRQWQKAFSLDEGQGALVQAVAADFLTRADEVRARYGQLDPTRRELTSIEKQRLELEVLDLQIQAETQILRHLTPVQREALRGRAPLILNFAPGNEDWSDIRRGSPL